MPQLGELPFPLDRSHADPAVQQAEGEAVRAVEVGLHTEITQRGPQHDEIVVVTEHLLPTAAHRTAALLAYAPSDTEVRLRDWYVYS